MTCARLATLDVQTLLRAFAQGRDQCASLLREHGVPFDVLPDDHCDKPGSIRFPVDDEVWYAEFWGNGRFKQLCWG